MFLTYNICFYPEENNFIFLVIMFIYLTFKKKKGKSWFSTFVKLLTSNKSSVSQRQKGARTGDEFSSIMLMTFWRARDKDSKASKHHVHIIYKIILAHDLTCC
jgi:hypothetical protein